ncbi:MAG: SAM-dependent methyltransferase [Oscillochloris sp.]|nr:SAM-dependent methyltransferase [Oscillochloris sp.]
MSQAAGKTGVGPAVSVAIEQHFPPQQRIITDHLARSIVPFGMRLIIGLTRPAFMRDWFIGALEKPAPGIWSGLMCRKRYIAAQFHQSLERMEGVVNLGAGFDTLLYQPDAPAQIPAWEVDQAANIAAKQARLHAIFGSAPAHITLVAIDFDKESLEQTLARHGYIAAKRTFFIWEAVTQYLSEAGVRFTCAFLQQAAAGSRLVLTFVRRDFLEGRNLYGQAALYQQYVRDEQIWRFGLDPEEAQAFLGSYGWRIIEMPGFAELAERYVKPTGRTLSTTPLEYVVLAERNEH